MNSTAVVSTDSENVLEQLYARALVLHNQDELDKALTVIETVLQAAPEWELALQLKSDVLVKLGCLDEALEVYRMFLQQNPLSNDSRKRFIELVALQRATTLIRTQSAGTTYSPALAKRLAPSLELPEATERGDVPQSIVEAFAQKLLEEALALDEQGAAEEAIALATLSLRLDPRNADAYNLLGALYEDRALPGQALRWYHEAVKLDPEFREARANLEALRQKLVAEPWVTIARYMSLDEAEVARSRLEVEGVLARVTNRALVNFMGAIPRMEPLHLKVPQHQAAVACDILGIPYEPEEPD